MTVRLHSPLRTSNFRTVPTVLIRYLQPSLITYRALRLPVGPAHYLQGPPVFWSPSNCLQGPPVTWTLGSQNTTFLAFHQQRMHQTNQNSMVDRIQQEAGKEGPKIMDWAEASAGLDPKVDSLEDKVNTLFLRNLRHASEPKSVGNAARHARVSFVSWKLRGYERCFIDARICEWKAMEATRMKKVFVETYFVQGWRGMFLFPLFL